MLIVQCPKCGKSQKTNPKGDIHKASKRCVYCGKTFKIYTHINKLNRVVKWN